jgi:hypothetical protein
MQGEPGLIIRRIFRIEVIEQQKWIEIIKRSTAEASFQPHPRTLDDGLRLDNLHYAFHNGPPLPLPTRTPYSQSV